MRISDLLNDAMITVSFEDTTKENVIRTLIDLASGSGRIQDKETALKAVMERERLMSTGLEKGVAVPHAKTGTVKDLVLTLGISREGVDFASADGKPSHLFFLLLAPVAAAAPNIQALAQIARLTGNPEFCEMLKKAQSPKEALEIIRKAEK
ncbi:MAG TPA: PTS sugar transporter subunit IIA [bacterium]|nr:PTS sugar transporter subunit IIA [bacterium]